MEVRFWQMDFYTDDHMDDLVISASEGDLICIVDEEAGGIIAYALGYENADVIMKALLTN